jgi:hypothetical protein
VSDQLFLHQLRGAHDLRETYFHSVEISPTGEYALRRPTYFSQGEMTPSGECALRTTYLNTVQISPTGDGTYFNQVEKSPAGDRELRPLKWLDWRSGPVLELPRREPA